MSSTEVPSVYSLSSWEESEECIQQIQASASPAESNCTTAEWKRWILQAQPDSRAGFFEPELNRMQVVKLLSGKVNAAAQFFVHSAIGHVIVYRISTLQAADALDSRLTLYSWE